jgi:hypothetical protein
MLTRACARPYPVELETAPLLNRYLSAMEARRIDTMVIVQKVSAETLALGLMPLSEDSYPVVHYVRQNFRKVDETEYFALFE